MANHYGYEKQVITESERESLYEKVWTTPLRVLAQEEGISDVALKKRLKHFDIPTPGRGYWAKVQAGKDAGPRIPLPQVSRESSSYIREYAIRPLDVDALSSRELLSEATLHLLEPESKRLIEEFCESFVVEAALRNPTSWVRRMKEDGEDFRKNGGGRGTRHSNYSYGWAANRLEEQHPYPFEVDSSLVLRVLRILDTLDKHLFEIEASVFEPQPTWSEGRKQRAIRLRLPFSSFDLRFLGDDGRLTCEILSSNETVATASDGKRSVEEQLGDLLLRAAIYADREYGRSVVEYREYLRKNREERHAQEMARRGRVLEERRKQLKSLSSLWDEAESMRRFEAELKRRYAIEEDSLRKQRLDLFCKWMESAIRDVDPFEQVRDEYPSNDPQTVWELARLLQEDREKATSWDKAFESEPPIPD